MRDVPSCCTASLNSVGKMQIAVGFPLSYPFFRSVNVHFRHCCYRTRISISIGRAGGIESLWSVISRQHKSQIAAVTGVAFEMNEENTISEDFDGTFDHFNDQLIQMSSDMSIINRLVNSSSMGIWEQAKIGNAVQQISHLIKAATLTVEKARETLASLERESECCLSESDSAETVAVSWTTFLDSRISDVASTKIKRGYERLERWHAEG